MLCWRAVLVFSDEVMSKLLDRYRHNLIKTCVMLPREKNEIAVTFDL